ncbi:MAG: hypothetical protein AAFY64_02210 [Pseudomonadota bacterium]
MIRSDDFAAIEIDPIDLKLQATAKRKRIPTLTMDATEQAPELKSEKLGGARNPQMAAQSAPSGTPEPEPAHHPKPETARRRPLSIEVPDYLARELKVKAATEAVTVRFLVLKALSEAGYRVDDDELEEDGRRLR